MSFMIHEDWITIGARRMNRMRTSASGKPVVMLHGVTRCWQTFSPLLSGLAVGRQIFGVDFRGHGQSDPSRGNYHVMDYVPDAVGLLLSQLDEPAVLYGHSLGAMVAAAVAAKAPELVRAIILEDPPFDTMGCRIRETTLHSYFRGVQSLAGSTASIPELSRAIADLELIDPKTAAVSRLCDQRDAASIRFMAKCLQRLDPDVLSPILAGNWLQNYDRSEIFRRICCPVLLLQADFTSGGMLTDDDAAEARNLIADCTHVRLDGSPHLMHWARTQEILNLVHAFIESLETPHLTAPRVTLKKELRV